VRAAPRQMENPMRPPARFVAPVLALALGLAACGDDDPTTSDVTEAVAEASDAADEAVDDAEATTARLADTLRENGLDSMASAVEAIDLDQILPSGDFTLFAPNDDAFVALEADQAADLLADPAMLVDVLRNHVLDERLTAAEIVELGTVETENGTTLTVTSESDTVVIAGAAVVEADVEAAGGVVHVVDALLLP